MTGPRPHNDPGADAARLDDHMSISNEQVKPDRRGYRKVAAASMVVVLLVAAAVWFFNRTTDSRDLLDTLAETVLPDGTYSIFVAPADDDRWSLAAVALAGSDTKTVEPLTAAATWVSYADAPATGKDDTMRHYDILTYGFGSEKEAAELYEKHVLADPESDLARTLVWRQHGSVIQGVNNPPNDWVGQFPKDAPIIDVDFKGVAYRINATGWAEAVKSAASDEDREIIERVVESLGVSTDPDQPSMIEGFEKSGGLVEGRTKSWGTVDAAALNAVSYQPVNEQCDSSGEQCVYELGNVTKALHQVSFGQVAADKNVNALFGGINQTTFPDSFLKEGNRVGFVHPRNLFSGLQAGAVSVYKDDFRWFNFAVTPKGTVLLEPHIEAWDE